MTGTERRQSARVILVDATDRVLLLRWEHPELADSVWWITPGGGLEPDEDFPAGAVRELAEEVGLQLTTEDLVGPVFERDTDTFVETGRKRAHEVFFVARVDTHEVDTAGHTAFEVRTLTESRWWSRDELAGTQERFTPPNLLELLP